ncbi:unnamed protein product [Rotaria socialis]
MLNEYTCKAHGHVQVEFDSEQLFRTGTAHMRSNVYCSLENSTIIGHSYLNIKMLNEVLERKSKSASSVRNRMIEHS